MALKVAKANKKSAKELVITRGSLSVSNGMTINGVWRNAGAVYTFAGHPGFKQILPARNDSEWALSWTTLPDGMDLQPHYHPFESHVAIVQGRAILTGESDLAVRTVEAGEFVRVPPWCLHGFRCENKKPFWALSWQRADRSLFFAGQKGETTDVVFPGDPNAPAAFDPSIRPVFQNGRVLNGSSSMTIQSQQFSELESRPKFQFFDFSTTEAAIVEFKSGGLMIATSAGVKFEYDGEIVELSEGDSFPVISSHPLRVSRTSPLATIATLQFT